MLRSLSATLGQACCRQCSIGGWTCFSESREEKMRRVAISGAVALFLVVLSSNGFAKPPIPLTDCETITKRGNYVLENDLVTSPQENCLVISSSHVNVDLNGRTITCLAEGFPCSAIDD